MKAAIYLRVSTEEQRERQSIATQREFAQRYCEREKIEVAGLYADDGVSGTVPLEQRPEGARLLADARAKKFESVLVYKLDRLGRDPRLLLNAMHELEVLGVALVSMTEAFDTVSPAGRFMRTILSGVAGLERENMLERSREGTNRLAREGAWLGGIVPFGYRVEGTKRSARLVVSDALLPGIKFTESEVIRLIYRLSGSDGKSCIWIADHLNHLGIPTAYVRDGRTVLRGKRRVATAGIWRCGRIRNLLVSTTYKGLHEYGRRSVRKREHIPRAVPALVDEALWQKAQETLRRNFMFSRRNARRHYLLRGLIKCAHCGLTYIGTAYPSSKGSLRVYYVCNGKHQGRAIFGSKVGPCTSKAIAGEIEAVVWRDVEGFLRHPGPVLRDLAKRSEAVAEGSAEVGDRLVALRESLAGKEEERNRVIGLFRRGRINESTLDKQLDETDRERTGIQEELLQLESLGARARDTEARLTSTDALLRELHRRLDGPLTWELKRQLIEALVEGLRVETVGDGPQRDCRVLVTYRFALRDASIAIHTPALAAGSDIRAAGAGAHPPSCRATGRG